MFLEFSSGFPAVAAIPAGFSRSRGFSCLAKSAAQEHSAVGQWSMVKGHRQCPPGGFILSPE
jgi:hypothetical protein